MTELQTILSKFINICILQIDQEGNILDVEINTKKEADPIKAKTIYDLFSKEDQERIQKLLELRLSQRKTHLKLNSKYGTKGYVDVEITTEQEKTYMALKFHEDQREKEIELEKTIEDVVKQAEQDKLTRLLNRTGYWNKVEKILQRKDAERELGIIMFDMDNLKDVNDTYGHLEGDEAIKEIGEIINDSVRSRDIACRYGGDEFLIIVEELTGKQSTAYGLANRLRRRISQSKKAQTTISIGVHVVKVGQFSKYLDDKKKLQKKWNEAVKKADEMAYKAKREGKDRIECSESVKK